MRKSRIALVLSAGLVLAGLGVVAYNFREAGEEWVRPLLLGGENEADEKYDANKMAAKNRHWTGAEAAAAQNAYDAIRQGLPSTSPNHSGINTYAGGALAGSWTCRGPFNMPGSFEFSEMDEGTDTVYAVTCGHYGAVEFIWKGTLAGDNFVRINNKYPARFHDLNIVPNGTGRRVVASIENGNILYTDDAGANWTYSTGINGNIRSCIVDRTNNYVMYATDGAKVYKSTDLGTSFTVFQTIGSSATNACLYKPRWPTKQNNDNNIYLGIEGKFYSMASGGSSFTQKGTMNTGGTISIGGDSRKLWVVIGGTKWNYSTTNGTSFTYINIPSNYYGTAGSDMEAGHFPGVDPENPNILIGGYTNPGVSKDGGQTVDYSAEPYWGYYQNAVGNDQKVRIHYHPDFQGNQFFYDKSGTLLTLRSSDGGVFRSYNEWTSVPYANQTAMEAAFYDITLLGVPSQECYRGGFIYGKNSADHMTCGTQDQGWQDVRSSTYGTTTMSFDQVGGGDGPSCITGDGTIGWSYNYQGTKAFSRFPLYNGSTYTGQTGTKSTPTDFTFTDNGRYFTPSVGDWQNGDCIWVLSKTLRRITYSGGTTTGIEKSFTNTNYHIQGIAQSHATANLVFAMQEGGIWKSTDRGSTWSAVTTSATTGITGWEDPNGDSGWGIPNFGMGYAPNDQTILFATKSGSGVRSVLSIDGGTTWINVTGSGANLFPDCHVNGMSGNAAGTLIFASTSMGPYVFVVAQQKWYPLATDSDVPLFWGQICYCSNFGGQEVVHFSTWGQGVWDFTIDNNSPKLGITSPAGSSYNVGAVVPITWSTNQTGTVTAELDKNGTLVKSLGTAAATGSLSWTIASDAGTGNGYTVKLTLGSLSATSGTFSIVPTLVRVPQKYISVDSYDSQNSTSEAAALTLDGDTTTMWHTDYTVSTPNYPHYIVYKILTNSITINNMLAFSYRPRNDGGTNGDVKDYQVLVSSDNSTWAPAVSGSLPATAGEHTVMFDSPYAGTDAVYVKFLATSEQNGNAFASMAEFNLFCDSYDTIVVSAKNRAGLLKSASILAAGAALRITLPVSDNITVTMFDVKGAKVFEKQMNLPAGSSNIDLSTSGLAAKQYVVRLTGKSGVMTSKIVLK